MPRGKKAGSRGRGQSQPQYPLRNRQMETSSFTPFAGTSSPRGGHRGLTLQDEARNTGRHHTFWETDQRLRHSRVDFVSAGPLDPVRSQPTDAESAMAEMTLDSPPLEVEVEDETVEQDGPEPLYFIDIVGDKQGSTGLLPPQTRLRPSSPTPSNSSDEVILFQGRNNGHDGTPRPSKALRVVTDPVDAKIYGANHGDSRREALPEATTSKWVSSNAPKEPTVLPSGQFDAIMSEPKGKRGPHSRQGKREEEDAIAADYIANMEGGEDSRAWVYTAWPERPLDVGQDETESPIEADQSLESPLQGGWDLAAICDFDDLSTSDGVMGEVQAVLSKRERAGGVQYLVVWDGQAVDEARWVPAVTLSSAEALLRIDAFEAEEKLVAEYQAADEDDSDDSEGMESDDAADDEDDQDLWQRKADHMTDEQIARLLSKQEELGMGSNELLLLDDDEEDDEVPLGTNHFSSSMLAFHKTQTTARGAKRPRGEFPDATAMANAYDGFDVMDFDRPSLRRKPKGRKGKLQFDLSDSELEASLQAAHENDRTKKKERKQEREALRAAGLLGSKNGKPDLKDKYREGMTMMAVKDEMKSFLIGNDAILKLPPMGKADRKVVHEIANAFNLKSKSAGEGTNRFPVLYRTSRTLPYVERMFDAVSSKSTRRFLPRMDVGGKRAGGGSKGFSRGGGFGNAGVSYRDGDVVGASAPELGAENRGRAMLEKMGWSTGTALGALNNKGILQPVSHVVKTTKAGLG